MFDSIYEQFVSDFEKKKNRETSIDVVSYHHPLWVSSMIKYVDDDVIKCMNLEVLLGHHMDEEFKINSSFVNEIVEKSLMKMKIVELSKNMALIRTSPDDKKNYYELIIKNKSANLVKKQIGSFTNQIITFTKESFLAFLKAVIEPLNISMA